MKKIFYTCFMAVAALCVSLLSACSEDNEGFYTATEDDFPQILLPWFPDWENGEPGDFKSISRDTEYIDSATVTPALYTTVEWFIDDEKVHEGKKIQRSFLAGEYILKIVATTTKGLSTSRTGKLTVLALEGDPVPGHDLRDRQVVPGTEAKLHGTDMEKIVKITIGDREAAATYVENDGDGYITYTVPADLALGTYRVILTDSDGQAYGGDKIVISDESPVIVEETLWEGEFAVTWGTPFNLLQTEFKNLVQSGNVVRAYVTGEGQGTMATAWWNNILTGLADPDRGDIAISGSMVLEFPLTDLSIQLMNEQDGVLFVGDGYTITKITKE